VGEGGRGQEGGRGEGGGGQRLHAACVHMFMCVYVCV
jgi:hypothetical protein